jgi:hypothetical protein
MNKELASVEEQQKTVSEEELVNFVMAHVDRWRDYKEVNYETEWDEYERLYYGIWSDEDKTRDSERSKIISPAMRQAVDNKTAEIIEATTGRGEFFDIQDDAMDPDHTDIELVKRQLHEDIKKYRGDKV